MEGGLQVDAGMLLASWPSMLDPNFMHSVVLICEHNEEGAFGLVVNRPGDLVLGDLASGHAALVDSSFPVNLGGPVDGETMQFVHSVPDAIPGGYALTDELWLGGDVQALGAYLESAGEAARQTVKIFLGYAGWGAAQLEAELSEGSWIPAPATCATLFGAAGEEGWRQVVRSIDQAGWSLDQEPPDISWN